MEMIIIPREELLEIISRALSEALKNNMLIANNSTSHKMEGGIDFALEILTERANINSKPTVYKWSHEGRIPCTKRGKKLWFKRKDLEAWIESGMPNQGSMQASIRLAKKNN